MLKLSYPEITKNNFYEIAKLSGTLTEEQQKCVAPNASSIGEGSVNSNAYYRGIYLDQTPVGFFMLFIPDENKDKDSNQKFYLWRFMIGYEHQKNHYGIESLNHIVKLGKERGFDKLFTSCHMGEVSPYDFYLKYGFIDTGEVDEGEQVLAYDIV